MSTEGARVYVIEDRGVLVAWRPTYDEAIARAREIHPELVGVKVIAVDWDRTEGDGE